MKKKILFIVILLVSVTYFSGITYSFFNSGTSLKSTNQGIASFVFETNKVDYINFDLKDLVPGDELEYLFSVTNSKNKKTSDVTIEYQLKIKTYHFIPTIINLYKIENDEDVFVGTCDEKTSRNTENEIICNMPISELKKNTKQIDNYKLKIAFQTEYNDELYSNLVDYIKIEINSWQKV